MTAPDGAPADPDGQPAGEGQSTGDDRPPGYGEALEELEALLAELEGADVDVDVLAKRVARGVELIRFCRARLEVVTGDVDAVVAELVAMESAGGGPSPADPPPGEPAG